MQTDVDFMKWRWATFCAANSEHSHLVGGDKTPRRLSRPQLLR